MTKKNLKKKNTIRYFKQRISQKENLLELTNNTFFEKTDKFQKFLNENRNYLNYFNTKMLSIFLTPYGKIRKQKETQIKKRDHKKIANLIKKARNFNLIPRKTITSC